MIVEEFKKSGKRYSVMIDKNTYDFSENTVVAYTLFKGHELSESELEDILYFDSIEPMVERAKSYAIRYQKGTPEVRRYLYEHEVSKTDTEEIIELLIKQKVIDDQKILENLISYYYRNGNGKRLILAKLLEKGYSSSAITPLLDDIDMDEYLKCLEKLYQKAKKKYKSFENKIQDLKIRNYLFSRGYTMAEIHELGVK